MPYKSQAQAAAMHAAAAGRSTLGIPKGVAQKFVADSHGQKVGKLPVRVAKTPRERVAEALAEK